MSSRPVTTFSGATDWLRSNRTLARGGALGLLVTIAAGTAGTADFTGARWVPHWHATTPTRATSRGLGKQPIPGPAVRVGPGPAPHLGTVLLWVLGVVGAVAVVCVVWRLIAGRSSRATVRRRDVSALTASGSVPEAEPDAPIIRRGVEQALRLLTEERTPGDAVMLAWLGLEQSAEDSGIVRKPAETPTEFTSRIMKRVFADDRAIGALLALYLRARFGDDEVTAADVTRAREALEGLVRSWNVDTATARRARLSGSTR